MVEAKNPERFPQFHDMIDTIVGTEEHKERHEKLHKMLDELVADFIHHNLGHHEPNKLLSNTSIMELIEWSYEQTQDPDGYGK